MLGWWESLVPWKFVDSKVSTPKKTADQFQQNEAFPGWWGWFQPHDFPFWLERVVVLRWFGISMRPRLSGYPRIGALSCETWKKPEVLGLSIQTKIWLFGDIDVYVYFFIFIHMTFMSPWCLWNFIICFHFAGYVVPGINLHDALLIGGAGIHPTPTRRSKLLLGFSSFQKSFA